MKKVLSLFLCGTIMLSNYAANAQQRRKCGSYEHYLQQLSADPSFAQKQREIERVTQNLLRKGGSRTLLQQRGNATYNIPVIVHVVYNTAEQNISDAQVQTQIDVLNQDYQLNNSDTASIPVAFRPRVADCKIQFCLAKRTPAGAATNGIVRKSTTITSFSTNDNVKSSSTGGDNAWDATQYLNLWVCNMGGGILGYAQFPGGANATDGVVILYTAFGTTGTAAAPFNLGRTATHEIGHWLNLHHIWGDDGTACTESDLVDDTPNQAGENYGCPAFPHVTCNNGPNGDMFMDYMDYVDDKCMEMFTIGQRDRMFGVLQSGGIREAITTSHGCEPPAGGGSTCKAPTLSPASEITGTSATIKWNAVPGAVTYNLQYKTDAASSYTIVTGISGNSYRLEGLAVATTYSYQVSSVCSATGSDYSEAQDFTTLAASSGCSDKYEPNNTLAKAVAIPVNTAITALISTANDKDYFKFSNTKSLHNIQVALTNLPARYNLKLYSPSGALLKTSQSDSVSSKAIIYNTSTVGTYKLCVYGNKNAHNTTDCYTLQVKTDSNLFRMQKSKGKSSKRIRHTS